MNNIINEKQLNEYLNYLRLEEKSKYTIDKYSRDIKFFIKHVGNIEVDKEIVIDYKNYLINKGYEKSSINSMLTSLNCFFNYMNLKELKVKQLKIQKDVYIKESKELDKNDYKRLLKAAKGNDMYYLMLETFASTGIRVSELQYFTIDQVRKGEVEVTCKNKTRRVIIPRDLKTKLISYSKRNKITSGHIFVGRSGKPINRSVIWRIMKNLCQKAQVVSTKVFPHNFRKLFARTFYEFEKDIAKLADILGHYNINTTRIYIMSQEKEHRRLLDGLGLVV